MTTALARFRANPGALAGCFTGAVIVQMLLVGFHFAIVYALDMPITFWDLAVIVPVSFIIQMLPVSRERVRRPRSDVRVLFQPARRSDQLGPARVPDGDRPDDALLAQRRGGALVAQPLRLVPSYNPAAAAVDRELWALIADLPAEIRQAIVSRLLPSLHAAAAAGRREPGGARTSSPTRTSFASRTTGCWRERRTKAACGTTRPASLPGDPSERGPGAGPVAGIRPASRPACRAIPSSVSSPTPRSGTTRNGSTSFAASGCPTTSGSCTASRTSSRSSIFGGRRLGVHA